MISLTSIEKLNSLMRDQLIKQSQLSPKRVLNALSIHGEDLDELISGSVYGSIEPSNEVILFELRSRNDGSNVTFTEENGEITCYKSYSLRIIIYGDESTTLVNKIMSRFRTIKVRNDLLSKGVYVEKISDPEKINEYKNDSMWIRNDMDIDISCKMTIPQVDDDFDYSTIRIDIIK